MESRERWLLPDGIEELLPPQAAQVEALRRRLLDLYHHWGYELVIPPLIEYTDSLLIGLGEDLDLHTFKLIDQHSGRQLGVRPDITPQVARIEAHALRRDGPVRLCYAGSVLHTRARSPMASRSPIQLGAELYGDASLEADIEVICLMLETLRAAGAERMTLDIGHQAIVGALLDQARFDTDVRREYFLALQHKAHAQLVNIVGAQVDDPVLADQLICLAALHGGVDILPRARQSLAAAPAAVGSALRALETIAVRLRQRLPEVDLHLDLGELHGYDYHTGLVFAAYVAGSGQAVANGGRYDDIGAVFGRARPATGFATDLKALLAMLPVAATGPNGVFAPHSEDPACWQAIQQLRCQGVRVVCGLPGQNNDASCSRHLTNRDGSWLVEGD